MYNISGGFLGFIFIPIIPAFILFLLGFLRKLKRRDWEITKAISVEDRSIGLRYPTPIVTYEVNGITYEQQSNVGQRFHIRPGKKLQVFYNPNNPKEMIIDTFIQRGSIYFLIGGFFLTFSFSSVIFYFIVRFTSSLLQLS